MALMNPKVVINSQENNILKFTLSNVHTSLANSLRRIILSEIDTVVFKTFPHSENNVDITINTTRLNNEIIKQRIGCIPIHINDINFPYQDYLVELDVKNDGDTIIKCTTENFQIKNITTNKYLPQNIVKEIFPPDVLTGDFIPITRIRPKLSENIDSEHLQLTAKLTLAKAKDDGMYNVVSTCSYGFTLDKVRASDEWNKIEKEMKTNGSTQEEIDFEKKNWFLLEAKRITLPNSFDYCIETIGVFTNFEVIYKACDIMISKCETFISYINTLENEDNPVKIENNENSTIENEYKITLHNEDYTLGNPLVYFLYEKYYIKEKTLSFVGFNVPHPHIPKGVIRIAFENMVESSIIVEYLKDAAESVIDVFKNIQKDFDQEN
tara:strand:+ start:8596 stop:9738 length:1143 start_codon:yes stop_codon:yes gene_type:complete